MVAAGIVAAGMVAAGIAAGMVPVHGPEPGVGGGASVTRAPREYVALRRQTAV